MKLTREQTQTILDNAPKGINKVELMNDLIMEGYEPEGIDVNQAKDLITRERDSKKTGIGQAIKDAPSDLAGFVTDTADTSAKRAENIQTSLQAGRNGEQNMAETGLQVVGQVAGSGADAIGNFAKAIGKTVLSPAAESKVNELIRKFGAKVAENPTIQKLVKYYDSLPENKQRDIDGAGGIIALASEFVGGDVAARGASVAKEGIQAGTDIVAAGAKKVAANVANTTDTILSKASNVSKELVEPDVSAATKVSLNPTEALKGTGQDLMVSVKTVDEAGKPKFIVKKLSELTPEEKSLVQANTKENIDEFTKQAKLFKNDRSVDGGSPIETVGKRADDALEVADKQRQVIGSEMGNIEAKYLPQVVPIADDTMEAFTNAIKNFDNPKFGMDKGGSPTVRKLISDFDTLAKKPTIEERLQFVRDWQQYLRDSKDAFGNFKENATVNTRVEQAVNKIKNETVDHISSVDKDYAALRKQYAVHMKLQDIGDALLGKDGALGERIKGAATVKRAIQSNSDAGARQFLAKLKEITGYDAIQEGDVALTAMENIGDYQGLSLLNILNEGKGGLVKRAIEKGRDILVGDDATRVDKYIKK